MSTIGLEQRAKRFPLEQLVSKQYKKSSRCGTKEPAEQIIPYATRVEVDVWHGKTTAKRLKDLEKENSRLKRLLADAELDSVFEGSSTGRAAASRSSELTDNSSRWPAAQAGRRTSRRLELWRHRRVFFQSRASMSILARLHSPLPLCQNSRSREARNDV